MNHSKPRSLFNSIFGMHCPKCREGDLFETGSFSFSKPFVMKDKCDHCNQNYMPEPGFYYGAMFLSYIIWGWVSVIIVLPLVFLFDWSVEASFGLLIFISAFLFVWLFRFARSLWIHINVKYRGGKIRKTSKA